MIKIFLTLILLCFGLSHQLWASIDEIPHAVPELIIPDEIVPPPRQDPLISLQNLIKTTTQQLSQQKSLELQLMRFQEARKTYTQNTKDRQAAMAMVQEARSLLKMIQEYRLGYLLPPSFMKEISFFAKFAEKKRLSSP